MEDLARKSTSEKSVGRAVRAVEIQVEHLRVREGPEKEKRKKFFDLLDRCSDRIFAGVEAAARSGEREFYLGTVPGFKEACDEIFALGLGFFKRSLLDEWLYERDLRHLFRGDGPAITW